MTPINPVIFAAVGVQPGMDRNLLAAVAMFSFILTCFAEGGFLFFLLAAALLTALFFLLIAALLTALGFPEFVFDDDDEDELDEFVFEDEFKVTLEIALFELDIALSYSNNCFQSRFIAEHPKFHRDEANE